MKLDCYAVLGLSPTAEDVVIRAAYLALMRRYHPDKNGSAEDAARVRAITQAYETIGDPVRRAEYDAGRWEHLFDLLGYEPDPEPRRQPRLRLPDIRLPKMPVMKWPTAPVMGAVAASALALVLAINVLPGIKSGPADMAPSRTAGSPEDKVAAIEEARAAPGRSTERERPSQAAASPSGLAATSPPQMATVVPKSGSAEPARAAASDSVAANVDVPPKPKRIAALPTPPAAAAPAPPKPMAVDERSRIEALERMSSSFYAQSVNHADDATRSQLQQARGLFLSARNACRSDSCVGDAHASYIRDISRIMQKPKQATP